MTKTSWYQVTALAENKAEISIDGIFGDYGITSDYFKSEVSAFGDIEELSVRLTSRGGEVVEGLAMTEFIAALPYKTKVHIEGIAGSMASFFAMAFDEISISKGSLFFIHNARTFTGGDADDFRAVADQLDVVNEPLVNYFKARDLKLSDEELAAALTKQTYYTAAKAKELGFVDKITSGKADLKAVAKLDWKEEELESLPKAFSKQVKTFIALETNDGPAVETTTEGKTMTDEKTYSEAELQAELDKVRAEANTDSQDNEAAVVLASMLSDENATIERVRAAADMGLNASQASQFMAAMAAESAKTAPVAEPKAEAVVANPSLADQLSTLLAKSEVNQVNKNAGSEELEGEKKAPVAESVDDIYSRINDNGQGVLQ